MRLPEGTLVFALTAGLAAVEGAARPPEQRDRPTEVDLEILTHAGLSRPDVELARRTAVQLLATAGIEGHLRICGADPCGMQARETVSIHILPTTGGTPVCGVALWDARTGVPTVLVYLPRLVELAHQFQRQNGGPVELQAIRPGQLVGLTVAHEVGHLLGLRHTSSGLMTAEPGVTEVLALRRGTLAFAPDQGRLMRQAAATLTPRGRPIG